MRPEADGPSPRRAHASERSVRRPLVVGTVGGTRLTDDDPHDVLDALLSRLSDRGVLDGDDLARVADDVPALRGLRRLAAMLAAVQTVATVDPGAPPTDPPRRDLAGRILGPWRLERPLGHGGMGEVWLAERCDGQVRQRVAIKLVRSASPTLLRRMLRERELLARLCHPNIARFLDAGVDGSGVPHLVMEYVEGQPIDRWCAEHRSDLGERIALLIAIGEALAHAHRHLVVHRDLKPANVLVDVTGQPRLLDFGIAKLLDGATGAETETMLTALTPAWAAPEQLLGGEITTATDVYALGLLAFHLLTGAMPALRLEQPLVRVAQRLAQEEPELASSAAKRAGPTAPVEPSALAGDLDAILARALRPEPNRRYPDVESLLRDLRAWQAGLPVEARSGQRGYRLGRLAWRYRAWIAAGALAIGGITAGGAVAWVQAHRAIEASRTAQTVQRFLEDVFISADPWRARVPGQPTTAIELAERGLARIEIDLAGQPRAQAELYGRLARVFSIEGDADRAEHAAARASSLLAGLPSASFAERAIAETTHAQYVFYAGDFDRSEAMLRALLARHGEAPLDRAKAGLPIASLLADIARDRGDYEAARAWLERAAERTSQSPTPQRISDNFRYYRAIIELRSGAVGAATDAALDALARQAVDPTVTPQWRAHVLDRCLRVLLAHGPAGGDLEMAERNRAQRAAMFGAGSGYDAQSQLTLAAALLDAGEVERAAEAARLAVAKFVPDRKHGPRDAAEAEYLLALTLLAQDRPTEAIAHARAALAIFERLGGADAPPSLAARAALLAAQIPDRPDFAEALETIARRQSDRLDLEAPRSLFWLSQDAEARDDRARRARFAAQGLDVLRAQGRPTHAFGATFGRWSDAPAPAAEVVPDARVDRLRSAAAEALARIDAELAAVGRPVQPR